MKSIRWMVTASVVVLVSGTVLAQTGPGAGMGGGPGMQGAGGAGMKGGGGARWGTDFTPGWSLMTPAERTEHQTRMRSMKTSEECRAYVAQTHEQMAERAKANGGKPLSAPRRDPCAGLKP